LESSILRFRNGPEIEKQKNQSNEPESRPCGHLVVEEVYTISGLDRAMRPVTSYFNPSTR
jgi:hypothetical protein